MPERFVSVAIQPDVETFDTAHMAAGEPGLPGSFRWKGQTLRISRVVRSWRETGPCDHGSSDIYVRKHWFECETDSRQIVKLYFDRQPKAGQIKKRWWLFSIQEHEEKRCRENRS